MKHYLEFEKPVAELENKIEELRHLSGDDELNIAEEVARLQAKAERQLKTVYAKLTPWQKCQVARHPERPHVKEYIAKLIEDFTSLAGDRLYAEDQAIVGGIGRFGGRTVVVMGQEKGNDTNSRVAHNFGMARPEGYRKAQRLMHLAQRFQVPVITFVDTAGAYPGVGAEERGQAEAIARCMDVSLQLEVPVVAVVVGEGGSGGAIALATADEVLMLEHSIYSVISPEGCASILWRSSEQAQDAAEALKLTAQDLKNLAIIDRIVPEPLGGAHRGREETIKAVGQAVEEALGRLEGRSGETLRAARRQKFLDMGKKGLS
ncbi:MAG TPA: acetyl-CoA carboxylase carboxyltransferase subunit alpha [Kiloniellales bacterium]|jgi:acetyl-CoA carboxylase carboxyl transferase subunit alpha|nr:acetyl-CoA carboxylase carboxyltransferase subunit alpha [Kiloniellales bacterium]